MKTIQRYFRVDRKAISLIRFTFEGYEGIAGVTTLNPATGLIVLNIAPGCEPDVEQVLQYLQEQVYLEAVQGIRKEKRVAIHVIS
ncbi:MAG: DUF4911 domain-containing protein [Desulfatirhabdiaceae bacterium]|nr:DUF4911 domain-containing protein [Desulfatirhabdiaceae bacterium]